MAERPGGRRRGLRPFWSGTISFGLVSVPVDLYPANRPDRVALRLLAPDGTPLARRYVCPRHDREVGRDEIVRGFATDGGDFVVVTDEELEALAPERSRDIDLTRFVAAAALDPLDFERAYFLTPSGDSTKAYRLLAAVMERSGRAGMATFVLRGREHRVAILAEGGLLRAETLRFPDEVRTPADVGLEEPPAVRRADARRYERAIAAAAAPRLDEDELADEDARRLRAVVERKRRAGEDVVEAGPAAAEGSEGAEVVDLMEVLKRSLEGGPGGRRAARRARPPRGEALEELSKSELYARARALDVPGRSGMTKGELVRALRARRSA